MIEPDKSPGNIIESITTEVLQGISVGDIVEFNNDEFIVVGKNVLNNIYKKYAGRQGRVLALLPKKAAVKIITHRGDIIVPVSAVDKVEDDPGRFLWDDPTPSERPQERNLEDVFDENLDPSLPIPEPAPSEGVSDLGSGIGVGGGKLRKKSKKKKKSKNRKKKGKSKRKRSKTRRRR